MSKIAVVTFPNNNYSKEYYFRTNIEDLESGDLIVVDTVNGFVTAGFERYYEGVVKQPTKWIVSKVDLTDHFTRLRAQARLDEIKMELENAKKQVEEMAVYEMLAKYNPGIMDLVEELKKLNEVL